MIKANELRIGNYILLDALGGLPQWHKVKADDIADIANGRITLSIVEPIPLTHVILKKCKFPDGIIVGLHGDDFIKNVYSVMFNHCLISKLFYVHQLQNLYFALTGEELIIDL